MLVSLPLHSASVNRQSYSGVKRLEKQHLSIDEMNPEDSLLTISEIAITLAAFTGLVAAFSGANRAWTSSELYRLRFLIFLSFTIIIGSILPFAISGWSSDLQIVWGIPSAFYGFAIVGLLASTFYLWSKGSFIPAYPLFTGSSMTLGLAIHSLIFLSAFSIFIRPSSQLMILGMLWCFLHGATVFLAMLTILWRDREA